MSVTDLEVANAVADLYGPAGSSPINWLHLDQGGDDDQVYWAIRSVNGITLVIFRGSITGIDWERDFEAVPFFDADLGIVHAGMFRGMRKAWTEALPLLGSAPWIACGHSLGAARAAHMAGLGVVNKRPPLAVILWGEPRGGGDKLVTLLRPIPVRSYRNRWRIFHDPVPDLPPPMPFLHAGGVTRPLIDVRQPPAGLARFMPSRYHSFSLYQTAISKLNPMLAT